jgi:hypothetical protein
MKRLGFREVLKQADFFFSGVEDLLRTTGVQIPAQIFRLAHGPPLGYTNGAHV